MLSSKYQRDLYNIKTVLKSLPNREPSSWLLSKLSNLCSMLWDKKAKIKKAGMSFRSALSTAIWNVLLFWLIPEGKLETMSKLV